MLEHACYFIGQAFGQVADSCMFCLCILSGKENCASTEVYVLYLGPYELADATAEFVNDLKHQFVVVTVDTVEKTLEFINGQISDDLAETFIRFGAFALSARNLSVWIIIVVDLHSNVKSTGVIKV